MKDDDDVDADDLDLDHAATVGALTSELAAHEHPIEMVLRPVSAFQLASLLQLAVRHPGVSDDLRRVAATFLGHVRAYFADAPTVTTVLRQGDNPAFDRAPRPARWRLRCKTRGAHVHARLFTDGALAGELTFRVDEWPTARARFDALGCELVDEDVS